MLLSPLSFFSRKQLQEVIDLLEYCTAMLRRPEEHDRLWELLVAARTQTDSLKQQLKVGVAVTFLVPNQPHLTYPLFLFIISLHSYSFLA